MKYLPLYLGCLLHQIDVLACDIAHHTDVDNASTCRDICNKNDECSLWTLISGKCFLKNEDTFPVASNDNNTYELISGYKNCSSDGN